MGSSAGAGPIAARALERSDTVKPNVLRQAVDVAFGRQRPILIDLEHTHLPDDRVQGVQVSAVAADRDIQVGRS